MSSKPPWPPTGKWLCKLAESKGWRMVGTRDRVRIYRSLDDPKILVFIEYSAWPLNELRAKRFIDVLGLTRSNFARR